MSRKNYYNNQKNYQPFLYIIDSVHESFDLCKYDKDIKLFEPHISFINSFNQEGSKVFLAFRKNIQKEQLYSIFQNDVNPDQLIQIPQLPNEEFENFPNEISLCPIPKCFYKKDDLESFLKKIDSSVKIYTEFDYRDIKTKNRCNSAIFYQFLNNLKFKDCSPHAYKSQTEALPIVFVKHIPKKLELFYILDLFGHYLKERVYTHIEKTPSDSTEFYSIRLAFKDIKAAEHAVDLFNFSQIDGQEINANLFITTNYLNKINGWKLIVEGIPDDLTSHQIYKAFIPFGKIYEASVIKSTDSPPYGTIQYFDRDVALDVEKRVNQAILNGCKINIFHERKIIIKNFSTITKEEIQDYFGDFQPISIKIVENNVEERPDVFISFRSEFEAANAIERALNMHSMGMNLFASFIEHSNDIVFSEDDSIYLSGLPNNYTQMKLIDLCKVYGMLMNVKIVSNYQKNGDFAKGFVKFQSQESAKNALTKMEGLTLDGNLVTVSPYQEKRPKRL